MMKNSIRIALLSMLVLTVPLSAVFAQSEVKAKQILALVSKKYNAYTTIKSAFTYKIANPQSNSTQTVSGTLYTQPKANKYYIQTSSQDMISDGKLQWTYLKEEKEVQLANVDNSPKAFNPAKLFTIYNQGFKSVYTGDAKEGGRTVHVIDLVPLDAKQSFFKVRLHIDTQNKQIASALIFDKNGSRYTYTVKSLVPNPKIPATFFTFDKAKHPGVEVVDLR